MVMTPQEVINRISGSFEDVIPKACWGETSLFYNPGAVLPRGVYFCTIKEKDGENDKASNLDRPGVFRVAIGLNAKTYIHLFHQKPARPAKGGIVDTGHDFTRVNELMPHPVYGWMAWVQILSPSTEKFEEILPLIAEGYYFAMAKFKKRPGRLAERKD